MWREGAHRRRENVQKMVYQGEKEKYRTEAANKMLYIYHFNYTKILQTQRPYTKLPTSSHPRNSPPNRPSNLTE